MIFKSNSDKVSKKTPEIYGENISNDNTSKHITPIIGSIDLDIDQLEVIADEGEYVMSSNNSQVQIDKEKQLDD